ncbi:androgen-dependent TFPI-regulating protein-like isoform X2 [Daktulosphaira vitifoliae]|uniref:androgen-dependent TFPI-regulating protein-like isoform X2 n=1 Tax=Daktulosphaira vitifoliae TaxID=58002 RepID=UPI0021AA9591|nr:androgen-dependent TFPI-regulating protein-like isoform X2 [Daktulosphaira vitifoliae]
MSVSEYLPFANCILHLIAAVTMVYSVYFNFFHVNIPNHVNPIDSAFGGKFKYLTFLNGCFSALFFTYAVVIDASLIVFSPDSPVFDKLVQIKSYFFASITFPLSMFVSTTFWSLWFINRNLVMPHDFDLYFPNWLNHTMHTFVFIFALLEMITAYRSYPPRIIGLCIHLGLQLLYLIWIHIVYSQCDQWVYPILTELNMLFRWLFFLGTFIYTGTLYLIGEYVNKIVWGYQPLKVQEKQQ